ncbi:MAG: tetratricopeptide repeat protein [Alistipes sp.]|nr:tetratricopeptide repeat protein [Alistipes sp.]
MKVIKIFLASSEELENDRNAFGNLVRRLDYIYEKRGVRVKLFEWEDYDAAYNDRRKQDEYNENVRVSDLFLAMFHTKAGKFTIEEFDVAAEEFRKRGLPKAYVYCKDLKDGETESKELKEFKQRLFEEMGHYWSRYVNRETMQLHFVMQLQLVDSSNDALKVEDGKVVLDGMTIARMENLPFAGLNEDFQKMSARLTELPIKIEKARAKVDKYPDDEDFKTGLQALLDEYNALKDEFAELQKNLFATAKRISQLQCERITDRMRRAMEAFNTGKVRDANIILDEAERDGDIALQEYKQSKELTEQKRQNVVTSIDELLLKASTTMADNHIPITERVDKAERLYAQADTMAKECCYQEDKYRKLLLNYTQFLLKYAKYQKALDVSVLCVELCERIYGTKHLNTAESYNNIALSYADLGDFSKSLLYYRKAINIFEKEYGEEHPYTASVYNNMGSVYRRMNDHENAFIYLFKALNIRKKFLGFDHIDLASSYTNIGIYYHNCRDFNKAQKFFQDALIILENLFGKEHSAVATLYSNIGLCYLRLDDFDKSELYHKQSLEIRINVLGYYHPDTATSYLNMGMIYDNSDFNRALEYYFKALEIFKKTLGIHINTAKSLNNIGLVYYRLEDYDNALEYYLESLKIKEGILGSSHPSTIISYRNISNVYAKIGDYNNSALYDRQANLIYTQKIDV